MKIHYFILIFLFTISISSRVMAQIVMYPEFQNADGKNDARKALASDSLVFLLMGEITTHYGFKHLYFFQTIASDYDIDIRYYCIPFMSSHQARYEKDYNAIMDSAIQVRYGKDFIDQLRKTANTLALEEMEKEISEIFEAQWEAQEDSTGIHVIGLQSSYLLLSDQQLKPKYPIYVEVWLEDSVWLGKHRRKGWAEEVSLPIEYRNYFISVPSSLKAKALSIAAGLEYEPIKGRDKYKWSVVVPIKFK